MCIGKAFIAIKGKRNPVYAKDSNDHLPLMKKYKLRDDRIINRNFVRLEAHPLGSLTSINPEDWEINTDEHNTLPAWFEDKQIDWLEKCRQKMIKFVVPNWIKDGVGGSLNLGGTKVTSLGELQSVGGSLYLGDTKVTSLGELQSVGGSLYLGDTKVTSLGDVVVKGQIYYS